MQRSLSNLINLSFGDYRKLLDLVTLGYFFLNIKTKNFVQHRIYECRHSTETKQTKE